MATLKTSPIPPQVTITLDKERFLKYPVPAIWKLEDQIGMELTRGLSEEEVKNLFGTTPRQRMKRVIEYLWAGLITDDPDITIEFVGNYVTFRNVDEIDRKVGEAFRAYMPELEPKKEEEQETAESPLAESGQPVN
jgi:hypothetical protein